MNKIKMISKVMLEFIYKPIVLKIKQLLCNHEVSWVGSTSSHHNTSNKQILFKQWFKCVKCEKEITIRFNEKSQIDGDFEYITGMLKEDKELK